MRKFIDIITEAASTFALTPEIISKLKEIRHECRVDNGGGGACHLVSEYIEAEWGLDRIDGTYLDDNGRPITDGHMWNELPDGSILDATADQLGEGGDIDLIHPGEANYSRYYPYRSSDDENEADAIDAIQSGHYDEATHLRTELGDGWWLKDKSKLNAYREMQKEKYFSGDRSYY